MIFMGEDDQQGNVQESTTKNVPIALDPILTQWMLNNDNEMLALVAKLHGFVYDPASKKVIQKKPMMNEYGIQVLVDTLLSSMNHKGIYLSNLSDNEVYSMANETLDNIARIITIFHDEFGINSMDKQYVIMDMMRNNMVAIFKRPWTKGEREFIRGFLQERTVISQGEKRGIGLFGGR